MRSRDIIRELKKIEEERAALHKQFEEAYIQLNQRKLWLQNIACKHRNLKTIPCPAGGKTEEECLTCGKWL